MKELYFPHLAVDAPQTLYKLNLTNSLGLLASAGELERKEFLRQISVFRGNVAAAACREFGFDAALYAIECQSAPSLVDEPPIMLSQLSLTEDSGLDEASVLFLAALISEDGVEKCEKLRAAFLARLKDEAAVRAYLKQPTAESLSDVLFSNDAACENFTEVFQSLVIAYSKL